MITAVTGQSNFLPLLDDGLAFTLPHSCLKSNAAIAVTSGYSILMMKLFILLRRDL